MHSLKNNSSGFFRYFGNTVWLFTEQILKSVIGLVIGVWIARYLGPEDYGIYSYLIVIFGILNGVARLGTDSILFRELCEHPQHYHDYLGTALWIRLITALGSILCLIGFLTFFGNDHTLNLYLIIISAGIIFQCSDVLEQYFLARVLAKIISICKIIQLCVSSVLKIYCIFNNADLIYFVILYTVDIFFYAIILVVAYKIESNKKIKFKFTISIAKKILKDSWPLLLSTIVVLVYQRADQIYIKNLLGDNALGLYAAALKFTDTLYFIPLILCNSLSVALINAKNINFKEYLLRLKRLYNLIIIAALICTLAIYLNSNWIIHIFYGTVYDESIIILKIHSITILFTAIGIFTTKWNIIENRSNIVLLNTLTGSLISLVGSYFLIESIGLKGAAITSALAHFVSGFVMNFVWKETRYDFMVLNNLIRRK